MSLRGDILKSIGQVTRRETHAAGSNVVKFPGSTKPPRKKAVKKPKRYKRITDRGEAEGNFVGHSGKHTDNFTKVTINGKSYMRRSDGALFALQRDGSWKLTSEPRAQVRKKGAFRRALPYIATGAAGGAAAYLATRERK